MFIENLWSHLKAILSLGKCEGTKILWLYRPEVQDLILFCFYYICNLCLSDSLHILAKFKNYYVPFNID